MAVDIHHRALAQPHTEVACIVPSLARALLALVDARGHSAERLCLGLGFSYDDLCRTGLLLSYQQTRALIERAQQMLAEPALGLATGARQTPFSWGLPGLAMLTCGTFGEAIAYGIAHQDDAGAMLDFAFEQQTHEMGFEVFARTSDTRIEAFLVEEGLASVLSISRHLVGQDLRPTRVEFGFACAGSRLPYTQFFGCPVHFGAGRNRMLFDPHWLSLPLIGYDPTTASTIRAQLDGLMAAPTGRHDLAEALARRIRTSIEDYPRQAELARQANLSERTLRRRLGAQDVSYRRLREDALYDKARDLLRNSQLNITEVAHATGYADVRAFRRAFKRWSGQLPSAYRTTNDASG